MPQVRQRIVGVDYNSLTRQERVEDTEKRRSRCLRGNGACLTNIWALAPCKIQEWLSTCPFFNSTYPSQRYSPQRKNVVGLDTVTRYVYTTYSLNYVL
jgi:hypothetical protein